MPTFNDKSSVIRVAQFHPEPYFDRFDVCEAYYALECDYNVGGVLWERPANRQRRESCGVQLERIGFRPGALFNGFESLSENGQAIYMQFVRAHYE